MSLDLNSLNPQQRLAVETTQGPLLLLAGAGSGKTRVITFRIAYLVQHLGIPPKWVLALTFTNKAAGEMNERVRELLGSQSKGLLVTTFHSLCVRLLREFIPILGFERNFVIFDTTAQLQVMKSVMEEAGLDATTANVKATFYEMMQHKGKGVAPGDLMVQRTNPGAVLLGQLMREYNLLLKSCNALDFEDILYFTLDLIKKHPQELAEVQDRWHYLMVDEYQDTNRVQYQILRFLSHKRRRLCVVGDDDQSIYGWRGADMRNILDFEKDFPDAAVIKLEQNYRSTNVILKAANSLIKHNSQRMAKNLWTERGGGQALQWVEAPDVPEELEYVVDKLRQYKINHNKKWNDFAFLYRSNFQSRAIEEVLREEAIPYQLVGGTKFFDRKEIQDCLAYLRFLHNPQDEISLFRILNYPKRGIGQTTISALGQARTGTKQGLFGIMEHASAYTQLPPRALDGVERFAAMMRRYLDRLQEEEFWKIAKDLFAEVGLKEEIEKDEKEETSRERKVNNYLEFVNSLFLFGERRENPSLGDFLDYVALFTDQDGLDEKADRVSLMTVHAAKGLEFEYVALTGLIEGQFPNQNAILGGQVDEERRLFYVALTRAQRMLLLSMSKTRRYYGETQNNTLSRFVEEIDQELFEISPLGQGTEQQKKQAAVSAREAFFARLKKPG